ncbi:hypothetical protein IHE45_17G095700 [Dioscorea alata]|uniref:Uncharacterized protein n=1 Tax=Dioscorea alata TaxID=55571 RepID=A0ACB7UE61_DIOAL|nr:hypothetical protein IHE45_17G095700 [Dioscorea alata]
MLLSTHFIGFFICNELYLQLLFMVCFFRFFFINFISMCFDDICFNCRLLSLDLGVEDLIDEEYFFVFLV